MLKTLELDDETFDDIFEYYKRKIPQIYKSWTDFNEHDPGITFLELFSWMKEMQQFHLDQIGTENNKMFLKLIGMEQKRKEPVWTYAILSEIEKDFFLPKNSRIYAGEILFETVEERYFSKNRLLSLFSNVKEKRGKGAKITLLFEHSFPKEKIHRLYFKIVEPKEGKRQPVKKEFIPLIQWKLEVVKDGKRTPCQILKDETYGLLFSGEIQFVFQEEFGQKIESEIKQKDKMFLCFTIEDGEYDIPPSIQAVEWNSVLVRQTETRSTYETISALKDRRTVYLNSRLAYYGMIEFYKEEKGIWYPIEAEKKEVLSDHVVIRLKEEVEGLLYAVVYDAAFETERYFEMDGFPFQKIRIEHTKLLQNQIEVIVEHPLKKGCFERYQRVENFYHSKPEDRHFVYDEEEGCLYFGDCERGMAPKGLLKIIRYVNSEGIKGNIKAHQLKFFEDGTIPARVSNHENTFSGSDKESIEECFKRFIQESEQTERAVTSEDYENLVLHTPGLFIHKVKATIAEHTVFIVVKPYSDIPMPKLSSRYERNIRHMLEEKRMLGTKIQILSPEYVGIYLFAEIVCKAHYKNAKEQIKKAVEQYFQNELLDFGKTLVYGKLYRMLESLVCVNSIKNLSVHAQGKGVRRSPNGDYHMPENALIYLKSADYIVTSLK